MKDLYKCSLDELLRERQNAIENNELDRYGECDNLINYMYSPLTENLINYMYSPLTEADCWDGDESYNALQ